MKETKSVARCSNHALAKGVFGLGVLPVLVLQFVAFLIGSVATSFPAYAQMLAQGGVTSGSFNLTGQWTSNQFQCPSGTFHTESVSIGQTGQQISAVKVNGDFCLPASYTLFQGTLIGSSGSLTCFSGTPQSPASSSYMGTLRIINANSIEACNMHFVRAGVSGAGAGLQAPAPVYSPPPTYSPPPAYSPPPDYTSNLVGSTWSYVLGGNAYQFTFGQSTIDNFSNGLWLNVTWSVIGPNRIRFWDAASRQGMVISLSSANNFTGIHWDLKTAVSGTRLSSAASPTTVWPGTATVRPPVRSPIRPSGMTKAQREAEVKDVIRQVKAEFKSQGLADGATAILETYGSLNARSYKGVRLNQLQSGYEYSIAVVCDNICGEISLTVYDGSGRPVGSNSGKKPIGSSGSGSQKTMPWTQVLVTPSQSQLYTARVTVSTCATNPCEWGLLVSNMSLSAKAGNQAPAQTPYKAPTQTPAGPTPRVADVLTLIAARKVDIARANGNLMFQTDGTAALGTGDSVDVLLGLLTPGVTYGFMGVCDGRCGDLNLWLIDNNGWVNSAIDTDTDNEPEIAWTALANQQYRIKVHMINCSADPCHWGLVGATIP